ncbi:5-(carboxyamino)imidazole ribonucleotide mutase [Methylotenera versatilis]|uniref:N5-carboxyaminoimidazole ribonucleotide mutase n=1 Tax=Methylotenera versatilis (strain 301) TaxID=666681 RepID=D7DMX9_METV0|nr:5-(carboxyamino)imidazole ribonucleotide mutase [Methylotenera versatilis]ADI28918.1 phosphoribosylaminoimidazole carboxylase, catalytic subunit [Methylotenera versatilis 301]
MNKQPLVAIIMGSDSDWPIMKAAAQMLADFDIAYTADVVSAHRTPDLMFSFAETAAQKGYQVIIAGAGGAAHLPGMVAAKTTLPVLGVPVPSKHLQGQDSLLSIVQMPKGIPVATFAIGEAGAANAGLFAASILANHDAALAGKLAEFRTKQAAKVHAMELSDKP